LFAELALLSPDDAFGLTRAEIELTRLEGRGYSLLDRRTMAGYPRGVAELLEGRGSLWLRLRRPMIAIGARGLYGWDGAAVGLFDCASGISEARRAHLSRTVRAEVLDDLRFHEAYCAGWGVSPLSEAFRAPHNFTVPALLYAGTFDVATPLENAREVAQQTPLGQLVVVSGGSHRALSEALDNRPELAREISLWLQGGSAPPARETLPAIAFEPLRD
jgi:pimeloyl-ACP methyl ester carboxylesterase